MESRILVIVIQIPGSDRSNKLLQQLSLSSGFETVIFPAVMYKREMKDFSPNFKKHKLLYGRELSDGEIGCTISHCSIYKQYSASKDIIVILEDDARIPDIAEFEELVSDFQNEHSHENAILSLLPWMGERKMPRESIKIRQLLGRTPLTVGYVITQQAMKELLASNFDFGYLPDWPPSRSSFYVTCRGVISHGDSATFSLIDRSGRRKTQRYLGLLHIFLITYFRSYKSFASFREYCQAAVFPSFTWRIDRFQLLLRKLVERYF